MCNARDYDADRYAQFLCVPCGIPLAFVPHDFQLYIYQLDSISLFCFVFFALLFFVRHILKLL